CTIFAYHLCSSFFSLSYPGTIANNTSVYIFFLKVYKPLHPPPYFFSQSSSLSTLPTNQATSLNHHQPTTNNQHQHNNNGVPLSLCLRFSRTQPFRLGLGLPRTLGTRDYNRWRPNHHNRPSRANLHPSSHQLHQHRPSPDCDLCSSQDYDPYQALVCD
ncbi:MAG: hypothetical protein JOS17DRAFT_58103, partial [Linnemannia elongata]